MMFKLLFPEPAIALKGSILIIADLHIGIEYELFKSGISIPSQINRIKKRIDALVFSNNIKHLIFLGDIKHNIPVTSYQEIKEIPDFLKHFSKKLKVSIVKGNHDGNIEKLSPHGIDIYDGSGFSIKNFGFIHGHAWPDISLLDCEYLVMGHEHPALEFQDSLGFKSIEHCWLRCKVDKELLKNQFEKRIRQKIECRIKEVIIIPSFSHIVGGMTFNKKDFRPLGPVFKFLKWKDSEVYLLDGTYLGNLRNLR